MASFPCNPVHEGEAYSVLIKLTEQTATRLTDITITEAIDTCYMLLFGDPTTGYLGNNPGSLPGVLHFLGCVQELIKRNARFRYDKLSANMFYIIPGCEHTFITLQAHLGAKKRQNVENTARASSPAESSDAGTDGGAPLFEPPQTPTTSATTPISTAATTPATTPTSTPTSTPASTPATTPILVATPAPDTTSTISPAPENAEREEDYAGNEAMKRCSRLGTGSDKELNQSRKSGVLLAAASTKYSGPTFWKTPEPSTLPIPSFHKKGLQTPLPSPLIKEKLRLMNDFILKAVEFRAEQKANSCNGREQMVKHLIRELAEEGISIKDKDWVTKAFELVTRSTRPQLEYITDRRRLQALEDLIVLEEQILSLDGRVQLEGNEKDCPRVRAVNRVTKQTKKDLKNRIQKQEEGKSTAVYMAFANSRGLKV